jgi:hypothetical protein
MQTPPGFTQAHDLYSTDDSLGQVKPIKQNCVLSHVHSHKAAKKSKVNVRIGAWVPPYVNFDHDQLLRVVSADRK